MHKISIFFAAIFTFLTVSSAKANFVLCVTNKTAEVHDVNMADEEGGRLNIRVNAQSVSCADVGEAWQRFQFDLRDAQGEDCLGKTIWPNQWVQLAGSDGGTRCSVHNDDPDQKKLKDRSKRFNIKNDTDFEMEINLVTKPSVCGYLEWVPLKVKAHTSSGLPVRIINGGECSVRASRVYFTSGRTAGGYLLTGLVDSQCYASREKPDGSGTTREGVDCEASGGEFYYRAWF